MNETTAFGYIGRNVLVTCSEWFFAPDGQNYKAVFGKLKNVHKDENVMGFPVNRSHANWFMEIGGMCIAGCQVKYIIQTDECNIDPVVDFSTERTHTHESTHPNLTVEKYVRPSLIYHTVERVSADDDPLIGLTPPAPTESYHQIFNASTH